MVMDLPDTPELVALSSNNEGMEDPEDDLQDDTEEDPELGEHQDDHNAEDAESGALDSSFDSREEPVTSLAQTTILIGIIRLIQVLTSQLGYILRATCIQYSWLDK